MTKGMVRFGYGSMAVAEYNKEQNNGKWAAHIHNLQVNVTNTLKPVL